MIRKVVRSVGTRLVALADAWDRVLWCEGAVGRLQRDVGQLRREVDALRRSMPDRESQGDDEVSL